MAEALEGAALERRLLEEVSPDRLMEYTRGIARWVRLSGTEDERRAVEYVRDLLDGFGLDTRIIEHDAYISLPGPAALRVLSPEAFDVECITHSMAASTPPEGLEGEVVFVEHGRPEDLERVDVRGKVALAWGLAMPVKVRAIERAGAAAQIHINAEHLHEMIVSTVWGSPTPETVDQLPRTPVVSIRGGDGRRLVELAARGGLRVRITARVDTGWRKTPLLVAELKSPRSDDFVMFSGHIDSWHYGAMDNGTANATMIEVARVLAPHRDRLRRGLRLLFWSGHSHGRYSGSTWYADHYWEELYRHCVAHVNIDSVGGKGATVLTEGMVMREAWHLVHDVIKTQTGQEFEGTRPSRSSDQSFWGIGIPSILSSVSEQPPSQGSTQEAFKLLTGGARSGGLGWWWHTTEDTVDKIDPEFLARDARIYVSVVYRLLTDPVLPFDYAETSREIAGVLEDLQAAAGDRFDLSEAVRRARLLEQRAQALNERAAEVRRRAASGDAAAEEEARRLNEALKRLGRILIPLNYSAVGPFDHDAGMPVPPVPVLQPVRRLAGLAPDSHEAMMLKTRLVRARNQVHHALAQALDVTAAALG